MFRSYVHLKLWFHLGEIFVGRPFIFSDKSEASPQANTPHTQPPDRPSRRAALIDGAIAAAFSVIDLCELLQETSGLARASYTEFSSCRAALLLLLARSLREYDRRTSDAISLGVQLLKVMASGNNVSTRSESSVVEAIETAVRKLHSRGEHDNGDSIGTREEHDSSKTGYERFKEWTLLWKASEAPEQPSIGGSNGPAPTQVQNAGLSWASNIPMMPDSLEWDTSTLYNFGISDIMNAFPQGPRDGGIDEWPRWE